MNTDQLHEFLYQPENTDAKTAKTAKNKRDELVNS
jgi:hypothetical protein